MSSREILQQLLRLWRIPVVALIAASLAFGLSYLISPTYESSSRLLIRGRDTTFLTQTGNSLSNQPGVIDSTLATALSETQSALLSTRAVATQVVDRLGLDEPRPPETGLVAKLRSVVGGLYNDAKAVLIHGYVAEVDPRTKAIEGVYSGLSASQVEGSYVLEVTALADNPQLAAAIADSAAEILVALSRDRFQGDATAHRDFLESQVARAKESADAAADEVRAYKQEHGIADLTLELELTASSIETLRTDLERSKVDLGEVEAALASVNASLASTDRTDRSVQNIETGRSSTSIVNESPNSVYQSLQAQREQLEAERAALQTRHDMLTELVETGSVGEGELTQEEAELRQLEAAYSAAAATYQNLNVQYEQAITVSAEDRVEITRVDTASVPVYPIAPKRYLYLALGMLTGAALGLALTVLTARRRGWWSVAVDGPTGPADVPASTDPVIDLTHVAVVAGNGARSGNGHAAVRDEDGRIPMGRFEAFAMPESEETT